MLPSCFWRVKIQAQSQQRRWQWLCCLGSEMLILLAAALLLLGCQDRLWAPSLPEGTSLPLLQAPQLVESSEHRIFILIQIERFYVLSFLEIIT